MPRTTHAGTCATITASSANTPDMIADGALRSEASIRDAVRAFEDIGVTELYFDPTKASLDQIDRLADLVL